MISQAGIARLCACSRKLRRFATSGRDDAAARLGRLALDFFRKNLAPVPSYAWSARTGSEVTGEPFEAGGHVFDDAGEFAPGGSGLNRILPFFLQDLFEAFHEEGGRGVLKALPAGGVAVQTYSPRQATRSKRAASGGAGSQPMQNYATAGVDRPKSRRRAQRNRCPATMRADNAAGLLDSLPEHEFADFARWLDEYEHVGVLAPPMRPLSAARSVVVGVGDSGGARAGAD